MKRWYRALSLALVLCFAVTLLTGCSSSNNTSSTGKIADVTATPMPAVDVEDAFANAPAATGTAAPLAASTPVPLSDKQRTSINMLNYTAHAKRILEILSRHVVQLLKESLFFQQVFL